MDGPLIVDELRLPVLDGELTDGGSWVYVRLAGKGVLYIGATGLPPTVRSWLHLQDRVPEVGRVRAHHPEALVGHVVVRAFRLAEELDRQQVRQAVLARLAAAPGASAGRSATELAAAGIVICHVPAFR